MDRARNLPGTPGRRALLRNLRVLLGVALVVAGVSSLPVILVWLGLRGSSLDRLAVAHAAPAAAVLRPPRTEELVYRSRDARIAARLHLPPGGGPHPALVVAHGSGRTRRDEYRPLAAELAARGYALLAYDKRGVGDSEGVYAGIGPENSEAMFELLADDVVAGVEYLAARADIDRSAIGVIGISQGGWIGPLAAAKSRAVSFLVTVSGPTVSVGEEIYYSSLTGEREGAELDAEGDHGALLAAFDGRRGYDPVPVLERVEVPGLWILGAGDRSIPIHETVERLDALIEGGKPFSRRVLPGVGHGMRELETGERAPVAAIAAEWLDRLARQR